MKKNKVYLIGAGPGDAGLMTVKGREILREADVVIYDYLVDKRILDEAKKGAELICCDKLGRRRYSDGFLIHNERISQLVIRKVKEGKKVIRLKNGDPGVFSRTSQELDPLVKERIEFEIVPGVTAASSASAFTGIPLTDRRFASSCVFVTGHEDPAKGASLLNWEALVKNGTIILYMAVENLSKIVRKLVKLGMGPGTPVAVIENAGLLIQRLTTGTLRDIEAKAKEKKVAPPAIIIIGKVVNLEGEFNWLRKGRRILFTGLSKERFFLNGTYFHLPLIRIEPMADYKEFDNYLRGIKNFDWVVFSSRYGVEYFFKRLIATGKDVRTLAGIKIAAIGKSTANVLKDSGVIADLVPRDESSMGLIKEFVGMDIKNNNIFLPRSDISDKNLSDGFKKLGAKVTTSHAYRNVPAKDLPDLDLNYFDEIMFTSPSGVRSFFKRYGRPPKSVRIGCIGDVTLKEAKRCRLLG